MTAGHQCAPQGPCEHSFSFFNKFIYFWLSWVFVAACGPSPGAVSGGHSSLQCVGPSSRWPLPLRSTGSRRTGSRAQVQQLWRSGLAAPWHPGSSRTRARTCVPALAGGPSTTVPRGKPPCEHSLCEIMHRELLSTKT